MAAGVAAVVMWMLVLATCTTTLAAARPGEEPRLPGPRTSSLALWAVVAVPSLLQLAQPRLLVVLRRDWSLITTGQAWRLVTSVVVQDGGLAGTAFNLLALALVLLAVQGLWSARRTWLTFWLCGVTANLAVGPHLATLGAGNSMATFALGCAGTAYEVRRRGLTRPALGVLACVLALAVCRDYHAVACLIGLAAGAAWSLRRQDEVQQAR